MLLERASGRLHHQIRDVSIDYNVFGYAAGSVLFQMGRTKVLCAVTLQNGVPPFLRGKKQGWLTGEYAMLPTATATRNSRENCYMKRNGRSIEISRLIGRSLRAVINLEKIGERTITIDCDVLQADGSTRTACISGSYLALEAAISTWINTGEIDATHVNEVLVDSVGAVSVGIVNGQTLLDLDFEEDSMVDIDYNFVLTQSGRVIEIQGSAGRAAISWEDFEKIRMLATQGVEQLFHVFEQKGQLAITSLPAKYTAQKHTLTR